MSLITIIKSAFEKLRSQPELPVNQDIVEREKRFSEQDYRRKDWVVSHVTLCRGGLDELQSLPLPDPDMDYVVTYFTAPPGIKGPCKPVVLSVPIGVDMESTICELDTALKLDLFTRGSNSGVFYQRYEQGGRLYAQAVPATLTGE